MAESPGVDERAGADGSGPSTAKGGKPSPLKTTNAIPNIAVRQPLQNISGARYRCSRVKT
jgi:hypothetical protein